jgi:hypothetical protein
MRREDVLYDGGRMLWVNRRPVFDPVVVRRELQSQDRNRGMVDHCQCGAAMSAFTCRVNVSTW